MEPWMTIEECADALKVSRAFIYKQIKSGTGPKFKKIGSLSRISAEDFKAWTSQFDDIKVNK